MNRLTASTELTLATLTSAKSLKRASRPLVRSVPRPVQPHCVLAPLHYERNYAYPLLVWLHDEGGSERELNRVMPLVSLRNYVSVAVRGTATSARGYAWPQSPESIFTAGTRVAEAVSDARQRFHIHPERVFLAGSGAGGTMALRLALRARNEYAGAASICGAFPQGHAPLARLGAARAARLLMMHGRDSAAYPVDRVCDELALFHAAGMSVTVRQYPCGDELTTQMLHDLDVWLMEQVTGVVEPAAETMPTPLPSEWN
jgi:phospholipase/carboxylesterase